MKNHQLIVLAAALCAAACTRMENPAEERIPVSLTYTTVQATETKAAQNLNVGTFAEGEKVGVRIRNTEDYGDWAVYTFTASEGGILTPPEEPPYYPDGGERIDIVACYPASSASPLDLSPKRFSVQTDQTSDASYKASDLMVAVCFAQMKQSAPVELDFTHLMSKLCVNITPGAGVGSINSVRILQVKCDVLFYADQSLASIASDAQASSIAMSNKGAACFPAQTITGDLLSIETDQGTATYSVPAGKTFEAGKQYTLNLTVNLREVGLTNVITGWTENGVVTLKVDQRTPAGLEAVDLGLYEGGAPSGKKLLWANMNLGATSVTGYGDYFAWGEVTGHSGTDGYSFLPDDYSYIGINHIENITEIDVYMYNSTDGLTVLRPSHDAASILWGDGWRMPTKEEFEALLALTKDWTTQDGVNGYRFTGNGKSIFLPAAGFFLSAFVFGSRHRSGEGGYWSSSLDPSSIPTSDSPLFLFDFKGPVYSWFLSFSEATAASMVGFADNVSDGTRWNGLTVRPVRAD